MRYKVNRMIEYDYFGYRRAKSGAAPNFCNFTKKKTNNKFAIENIFTKIYRDIAQIDAYLGIKTAADTDICIFHSWRLENV